MVNYGAKELANAFRTVRGNTIQTAQEITEDKYDFSAAPGVRTVRELLRHVAFLNMLRYDFHRDLRVSTLQGYDFRSSWGASPPKVATSRKLRTSPVVRNRHERRR